MRYREGPWILLFLEELEILSVNALGVAGGGEPLSDQVPVGKQDVVFAEILIMLACRKSGSVVFMKDYPACYETEKTMEATNGRLRNQSQRARLTPF